MTRIATPRFADKEVAIPAKTFQLINNRSDGMELNLNSMPLQLDSFHHIVTILVKIYELDCKMNTIIYNFVIQSFQHER